MSSETVVNAGSESLFGIKSSITEIRCEECGKKVDQGAIANSSLCPDCGGHLVGIRIFRHALTSKILFAERVDL